MANCLIYNSKSGGFNPQLISVIKKKLLLINPHLHVIDAFNNIVLTDDLDLICVAGGDGTINNTVTAIYKNNLQDQVKLIIVPLGSANLLGHALGINRGIIFKNWCRLKTTTIETAKINDHIFLTASSLGNISTIINQTKKIHKGLFGFGGYILNLLKNWTIYSRSFTLNIDGEIKEVTANSVVFSIGLNIIGFQPRLKKPDGLIDVYLLNNKNPFGYLLILLLFVLNKSGKNLIKFSGKNIQCQTKNPSALQIDGEKQPDNNLVSAQVIGKISVLV